MPNSFSYSLPAAIADDHTLALADWSSNNKVSRLWAKDASLWTNSDEARWLDWLDIVEFELANAEQYRSLHDDISSEGFTDVLLMGMGGSSLCPEVLAMTFGKSNFHILDSTVPAQVASVEAKLDLANTLFIVASKSGSTLEPNCFKQYFFDRVSQISDEPGKQFVAITDPGSKMEQVAKADGFRHIIYGKPQIGGRFSALSAFGMTAAASMGIDVEKFLHDTMPMVDACRNESASENPGVVLGTLLGVCHKSGRDKLTIVTSPQVHDLGAWMEQLVAESTGKNDVAIIPVDREAWQSSYSNDRVFAFVSVGDDAEIEAKYNEVTAKGHPAVRIEMSRVDTLGQEFFRWEFATAVAGAVMNLNPFDQPDVESAKIEARKITDEYEASGHLPAETPFFDGDGVKLFAGEEYSAKIGGDSLAEILANHLSQIANGDYFAILGYIEMTAEHEQLLQAIRTSVLERHGIATCLGFGPRFLHSTGQAYKGGANNGVFLQITSDDAADLPVPGQSYTFGVVKAAQSRGDFQVLVDRGRRALRIHLGSNVADGLERLSRNVR
ncbi:MAG TPA: bifunctional transaldolase/phosoglucose isomerase [Pyrinomonadaceae bacterium]|nr:bifunctional transaldolase/phosoglucose isomerase [Pyrinomonadaceae bacterium]